MRAACSSFGTFRPSSTSIRRILKSCKLTRSGSSIFVILSISGGDCLQFSFVPMSHPPPVSDTTWGETTLGIEKEPLKSPHFNPTVQLAGIHLAGGLSLVLSNVNHSVSFDPGRDGHSWVYCIQWTRASTFVVLNSRAYAAAERHDGSLTF